MIFARKRGSAREESMAGQGYVYAGAVKSAEGGKGGVFRQAIGGEGWEAMSDGLPGDAEVHAITVHPDDPNIVFLGTTKGAYRSTDNGGHWQRLALACSAAAPGTVFLANRMGLFRSDDRGAHWADVEVGRYSPMSYGRDLRVSPHDPKVLYAALSPAFRSADGAIYRSDDVGRSWKRFDHGVKADNTMMGVAPHPRDPAQVYAVSKSGQVFGTRDGGESWRETRLPQGIGDCYAIACG